MGLLDKVKTQASQAAQKAQEAGKTGQAKLEEAQAKRKLDALFRDLGAAVYSERTGKPGADPAVVAGLIDRIVAFEAEHPPATASPAATDDTSLPGAATGEGEPGSPA